MGLSVTERLLELGWNVMILDFNEEAAKKVSERLGGKTAYIKVDTGDYESQAKAFVETWKKWSRLDFVFANAVSPACSSGNQVADHRTVGPRRSNQLL